jgi:hypothetical protein
MAKKITQTNSDSNYLVVPVDVEAMCVGHEDDSDNVFTDNPYQFNLLTHRNTIPLSKYIHKGTTSKLEKGIYIHWALPDGLTHGINDNETNEVKFPAVPNRWLVARMINGNENTLKYWVVESDYVSDLNENDGLNIPGNLTSRKKVVQYMGRVTPLETWKEGEQDTYFNPLTAMGYGIPEFAASYQHSKGVFGFYDKAVDELDVVKNQTITYSIIGWYKCNDEENPILSSLKSAELSETLAKFKWCLPNETSTENLNLNDVYFSGSISSIDWNINKKYLNDLHFPAITIAAGHTENEALSALIANNDANKGEDRSKSEQLLNALQLGLLEDVVNPSSINAVDNLSIKLNDSTFQTKEGGSYWQIDPEQTNETKSENNLRI